MQGAYTASHLLLHVLDILLEGDVLYLLKLEEQLEDLEEVLLERIPENFYEKLISYRKELYRLHAYYEQLMNIGDSMQDHAAREKETEEDVMWHHYTSRAERLHNHTEMTTIFLPLTLIAVSVVIMLCEVVYFTRKRKSWNPK